MPEKAVPANAFPHFGDQNPKTSRTVNGLVARPQRTGRSGFNRQAELA